MIDQHKHPIPSVNYAVGHTPIARDEYLELLRYMEPQYLDRNKWPHLHALIRRLDDIARGVNR